MVKDQQPNSELSSTEFQPFNHGSTSVEYQEVTTDERKTLESVLESGWGIKNVGFIGQPFFPYITGGGDGPAEISSNNYRVDVDDKSYLLKKSNINNSEEQRIINESIIRCEEVGVPVAHLFLDVDGKVFWQDSDGEVYCLFDFIDGELFDGSRRELTEVGSSLGHFLNTLANLPQEDIKGLGKINTHHDWDLLEGLLEEAKRNSEGAIAPKTAIQLERIKELSRGLRDFDFGSLPSQVVHDDLHPHNLIFDKTSGKLLAFIDFDSLSYTQRIRSVAFALHRLSRTYGPGTERKNDVGSHIRDRAKVFLGAYLDSASLYDAEVQSIQPILVDEALNRITIILGRSKKGDNKWVFDIDKQFTTLEEAATLLGSIG